jgi:DNA-directed RNA polymerase subunit RPC12/RpoP
VAENTTFAPTPKIPVLDDLPEYTNKALFNATGTSELGTTVYIFIDDVQAAFGATTGGGTFTIPVTLSEGGNDIKARAENTASILSGFSAVETVILDTLAPTADAGADMAVDTGTKVELNASASTDNYGIANYTWEFAYGGRAIIELYGIANEFTFNMEDEHFIELTVTDLAGNTATDSMYVNVTKAILRPWVLFTTPENNGENVSVDSDVVITFDLSMNASLVVDELSISPSISFTTGWSDGSKVLSIDFEDDLDYTTTYTVTIGTGAEAETGGLLNGAPFTLTFTTVSKPIISITIDPITATDIQPGDTITVSGSSTNIDTDTNVSVTMDGQSANSTIGTDGTWTVSIKVPSTPGDYTLTVTAGGLSATEDVTVQEPPTEQKKEAEEGANMLYISLLLVIIIVVILVLLIMMRRKKKPEEEIPEGEPEGESRETEDAEESEGAFEEEEAETDEEPDDADAEGGFECPDCGAELGAGDTICPSCGSEFEGEEEDEEEAETEAVADMQTVACPKCGMRKRSIYCVQAVGQKEG